MKTNRVACGLMAGLLGLAQPVSTWGAENAFRPGLGIGLLVCPGFNDYMEELSSDGDAASAWLNVHLGVKIRVTDHWAVVPILDAFANGNGGGIENRMQALSANARYTFKEGSAFYLQGGPGLILASGGGDKAEFEGGNLGGVISAGFAFKFGLELDLGYNYCPVDVTRTSNQRETTENFGGPQLRAGFRF